MQVHTKKDTDEMIQEAYNEDKRRETEENENRNELMAAALGDDNNVSQKEASESPIDESYKNAGFKWESTISR